MIETQQFFDQIFQNAKANAILIMDEGGIIDRVNGAFTSAYGYTDADLKGKHFRILYLEKDQLTRRPEIELNTAHREGSAIDENYLVHKSGIPIWVTGESALVKGDQGTFIVKIIHNIHAQKQLERYLMSTSELLESLFESVHQRGLLIIDSRMKVVRVNEQLKTIFKLTDPVTEGSRLQELRHPFWSGDEIKNDIRDAIVNGSAINKDYVMETEAGDFHRLHITSKILMGDEGSEKRVLLMIRED